MKLILLSGVGDASNIRISVNFGHDSSMSIVAVSRMSKGRSILSV